MKSLLSYLQQPTTVGGISGLIGTLMGLASGGVTTSTAVSLIAGSIAAILLPDNSAAKTTVTTLATDATTLATQLFPGTEAKPATGTTSIPTMTAKS